jgi:pyruvate/2-oxoglutarate dehydrogenase complex dihydrolipoamide dehydrogenase (E3) component
VENTSPGTWRKSGQKTAVVERRWIGGSCPNTNCLPSKNEIWSAKVANLVYHASKFGSMTRPGPVGMAVVRKRKREMVEGLIAMHLDRYKATGAELILGEARFSGNTIDVKLNDGGTRTLHGERIFLNLGTHAGNSGDSRSCGFGSADEHRGALSSIACRNTSL